MKQQKKAKGKIRIAEERPALMRGTVREAHGMCAHSAIHSPPSGRRCTGGNRRRLSHQLGESAAFTRARRARYSAAELMKAKSASKPKPVFYSTKPWEKTYLALRTEYLAATLFGSFLAGSLALFHGSFNMAGFLLAIAGVLLAQGGTNLANDYFSSIRLGNGPLGQERKLHFSIACFLVSILVYYNLSLTLGPLIFMVGIAGVLLGFFYSAPPISLGWRKMGEAAVFLGMGPLLFAAVYFASSSGHVSFAAAGLSLFSGALMAIAMIAAQHPDIELDRKARKHTLAGVHGKEGMALGMMFFIAIGALGAGISGLFLPIAVLACTLPAFYLAIRSWKAIELENRLASLLLALKAHLWGNLLPALALLALAFFKTSI